ncbi:MAG: hypothetical protein MJ078_02685, partial [Clostridia bacterium]|nr:hypothetical protein [Clostridia bacterium]
MLTYLINTSENKTFDSALLFRLAGYDHIRWRQCSLEDIGQLAENIKIEMGGRGLHLHSPFRVVVLVDLYRYPFSTRATADAAGDYVDIYKTYINHYLWMTTSARLDRENTVPTARDILHWQYT